MLYNVVVGIRAHLPVIQATINVDHEKSAAWFPISMHAVVLFL